MNPHTIRCLLPILVLASVAAAQPGPPQGFENLPKSTIIGQVLDADLNVPIEYANIVIYSLRDSSQVTGGVTDPNGRFELTGVRPGRFYAVISFIGYEDKTVAGIQLPPGTTRDLGRIELQQTAVPVTGVEATAERPKLTYKIDKKVVDVAHQPTPATGTAVDALENVPSVKVDDEGNVTLRGSGNFKVLVDGRPSPLEGSEALQQIPASTIDNIEIITNPSAKYDPEGPAGIINVVLKKQRQVGISGIANAKAGTDGSYGGDFLVGWREGVLNLFAGADVNRRTFPGRRDGEGWTYDDSTGDTTFFFSHGQGRRGGYPWGARAGGDIQLGSSDRVSLTASIGRRSGGGNSTATDTQTTRPSGTTSIYGSGDTSGRSGNYLSVSTDETHNFGRTGHDLIARVGLRNRSGAESSTSFQESAGVVLSGRRTSESGPSNHVSLSLDYTLPLRAEDKFEAGYSGRIERGRDSTNTWEYDTASRSYVHAPGYSHVIAASDNVHALYSTYALSLKPFGVQLGLRGEYSDRRITLVDSSRTYPVGSTDFFPSLHLSYTIAEQHELMASYTRRIERPGPWELEPFITWWSPHLVRRGNPDLKPEYIDALELGWQVPVGIGRLTLDGYHRITHNKIEDYNSVYAPQVFLRSVANVGTDYSTGAEALFDLRPARWLGINLSGDVYDYRMTGTLDSVDFESRSFNWEGNVGLELRPLPDTRVQLNVRYEGPSATAQGTENGFLMSSASVRQQFLGRRLSLSLQAYDLLGSSSHGGTSGGAGYDFYTRFRFRRTQTPSFSLGLTWNFNNFRVDRRRMQGDEGGDENGSDMMQ